MYVDCKVVPGAKLDFLHHLLVLAIRMQKRVVERRRAFEETYFMG